MATQIESDAPYLVISTSGLQYESIGEIQNVVDDFRNLVGLVVGRIGDFSCDRLVYSHPAGHRTRRSAISVVWW
jgi:hypothetical protein